MRNNRGHFGKNDPRIHRGRRKGSKLRPPFPLPVLRKGEGKPWAQKADAKGPDTGADVAATPEQEACGPATQGTAEIRAWVLPGEMSDRAPDRETQQSPASAT